MLRRTACLSLAVILVGAAADAQVPTPGDRRLAMASYRQGCELMRAEAFDEAGRAFQTAIDLDGTFEMAHYMLGRVRMVQKRFVDASAAFARSRSLFQAAAGRQFATAQDAQRYRRDQMIEIDELIRQLQTGPQTMQVADQLRQLSDRRRALQENLDRGTNMTLQSSAVPAFVSLSLGSAYFRMGNLAEAEKAYKETVAADPKSGEAHNNLAVVYLETGRLDDADKSVRAAEKAGFKVHPDLKDEIGKRRTKRSG